MQKTNVIFEKHFFNHVNTNCVFEQACFDEDENYSVSRAVCITPSGDSFYTITSTGRDIRNKKVRDDMIFELQKVVNRTYPGIKLSHIQFCFIDRVSNPGVKKIKKAHIGAVGCITSTRSKTGN